jgi:GNAT superfamily N-acetyltransferase
MLTGITFQENGPVDADQLNSLYRLVGWDREERRTRAETEEMLHVSQYHMSAHTSDGLLVGFARVCGDPYIAHCLDLITHPDYRRRGIASRCAQGVVQPLRDSDYVVAYGLDGSGIDGFYSRFGFRNSKNTAIEWVPGRS